MGSHRASRSGRTAPAAPVARLARFAGATLTDQAPFGGGAERAQVRLRVQTVAYGYLGWSRATCSRTVGRSGPP